MNRSAGARALALIAILATLIAGCGKGDGNSSDDISAPLEKPSTSDPETGSSEWVVMTDESSRVSFSLPQSVEPETRDQTFPDGSSGQSRLYQVLTDGTQVAVTITTAESDLTDYDAMTVYRAMVSNLSRVGADDAKLSRVHTAHLGDANALDATLTFTAKTGDKNYCVCGQSRPAAQSSRSKR